jgi:aldehyde dehydrogenase (NAD+)
MIDVDYRLRQLKLLKAAFIKYEKEINYSNLKDLGQKEFMSHYTTFNTIMKDVEEAIENVKNWSKPRSVDTPALLGPGKSYILPEPYGLCLIMSAWNFQMSTLFSPLCQAIAAGNCILAKPSEMASVGAKVSELILSELDPEIVQLVQGGAEQCIELLKLRFDLIIFTGSPQKGVLVAKAAAEFLTPCMLELGGQNPVIVDSSANLENAAYNILNGRTLQSGQICLAAEYVLVERNVYDKFIEQLKLAYNAFFNGNPKESNDYARIINHFHAERLHKLINDTKSNLNGGQLIIGGDTDVKEKYISPTVFKYDTIDKLSKSPLAACEIFGPILYMAPYDNIEECVNYINSKEKPLALYYFGNNSKNKNMIEKYTSSGALLTNDCVVHITNLSIPFGGVGNSGYSAYHGIIGFNNMSHLKPVMDTSQLLLKLRYPPFTNSKQRTMRFLLKNVKFTQYGLLKLFLYTTLLIVSFYLVRNCGSDCLYNIRNKFKI